RTRSGHRRAEIRRLAGEKHRWNSIGALQRLPHLIRRIKPSPEVLGERAEDHLLHSIWNSYQRRRIVVHDAVGYADHAVARERLPARDHLIEHDPEREKVGPMVHKPAFDLLGRHVTWRSEHLAFACE